MASVEFMHERMSPQHYRWTLLQTAEVNSSDKVMFMGATEGMLLLLTFPPPPEKLQASNRHKILLKLCTEFIVTFVNRLLSNCLPPSSVFSGSSHLRPKGGSVAPRLAAWF